MADIGERIKHRREELGLTQLELSKRMGYTSKTTISKVESGINDVNQSTVVKYAEALHTTIAYLMGWDEKESSVNTDILARLAHYYSDHSDFIEKYMELSPEGRKAVKDYTDFIYIKEKGTH